MEENLKKKDRLFGPVCTEAEAGSVSPLVLAFEGDAVYELAVRTMLVQRGHARPNALNRLKSELVKAGAQSAMMETIEPLLTEKEAAVYRRGRNAKAPSPARHASIQDYRRATGFEALAGYLYLCGEEERLFELIEKGISSLEERSR